MTPWERYDGQHIEEPRIAVYRNGDGRINAPADRRWFADVDTVTVYVDRADHRLAIVAGDDGPRPLALSREHDAGGDIAIVGAIKRAGVDPDTIDETQHIPLEETTIDGKTAVVADVSSLVDTGARDAVAEPTSPAEAEESDDTDAAAADGVADEAGEATGAFDAIGDLDLDTDDPTAALETVLLAATADGERHVCEAREIAEHVPLSSRQVGHHMGTLREECVELEIEYRRANDHPEWDRARWVFERADSADGESEPDAEPELDTEPLDPSVREVQRAVDDVETVQELADTLNLEVGQARKQARRVGAYGDLVDEVQRPGVSR